MKSLLWKQMGLLVLALSMGGIGWRVSGAERPNIVWLVTEDNSAAWLRLYHPAGAPMPNIERLAAHGIVFGNAFANAPVCSVSRSTIISGCYAPRLGVQYHRAYRGVPMPRGLRMFPWYLRRAGYYTTNNSKEDYNFAPAEKAGVWDESSNRATYRNRPTGQPFFHVQNYGATHESSLHPTAPGFSDPPKTDPASVTIFPVHPDTEIFRHAYARYLDRHAEVDRQMGGLLAQLESDGLLEDTFIFYYGDHGGILPRSKGYAYNDGLQVPMIVYIPENWRHLAPVAPGGRLEGFVQFVDLSATVLNLAGVPLPGGMDGRPFLGQGVQRSELETRDIAYGHADRFDEKYDLVRTLRKGRYRYVRNYQPFNVDALFNHYRYLQPAYREWLERFRAGRLNAEQRAFFEARPPESLFDLETDPHEAKDLAGDPAYGAMLEGLRSELQAWVKGMPDLSFIPEPDFLREGIGDPVGYGREQKQKISRLVDIADLALLPFESARAPIANALASADAHDRYWGLIVCSRFGSVAEGFEEAARRLAEGDPSLLVRVRAAEFLALSGAADYAPLLEKALLSSKDPFELALMLNSVVLLRDFTEGFSLDLSRFMESLKGSPLVETDTVRRRVEYLSGR